MVKKIVILMVMLAGITGIAVGTAAATAQNAHVVAATRHHAKDPFAPPVNVCRAGTATSGTFCAYSLGSFQGNPQEITLTAAPSGTACFSFFYTHNNGSTTSPLIGGAVSVYNTSPFSVGIYSSPTCGATNKIETIGPNSNTATPLPADANLATQAYAIGAP